MCWRLPSGYWFLWGSFHEEVEAYLIALEGHSDNRPVRRAHELSLHTRDLCSASLPGCLHKSKELVCSIQQACTRHACYHCRLSCMKFSLVHMPHEKAETHVHYRLVFVILLPSCRIPMRPPL